MTKISKWWALKPRMSPFQIRRNLLVGQSVENVEDKGGEVVQASADGAYDADDNFEFLEARIPAIKIRKNAILKYDVTHTSFFASLV